MQRLKWPARFVTAMFCALALLGCGGGGSKPTYQTESVEGVVTLDGDPVPGATVTFVPVNDDQGVPATGTTNEKGQYTLTTIGGGITGKSDAGTVAGEYYVGVVKNEVPPGPESHEEAEKAYEANPDQEGKDPKITYIVPQKYNNPRKSGVKVTVEKGKNDIPIELSAK